MRTIATTFLLVLTLDSVGQGAIYHVATNGNDASNGTLAAPFRTIQHAADLAQPGDVITVHEGIYRQCINPPRGGKSDRIRITYEAAPGEPVHITGSEIITNWVQVQNDVWKTTLSNEFFGRFNPYSDLIHGDWFDAKGRNHHTGAVYLNGEWLTEAASLEEVKQPPGSNALWFAEVNPTETVIWAQFKDHNPNQELVEINVRRTVFYPGQTGINYLTVRGFILEKAATPWAPPTAEQIGLIGTHWSKGWIIESNVIRYSTCSGIALGKYGDAWDNRSESAEGYVATIKRALSNGWSRDHIGHHLVRNNDISHCEQTGIVGSLGAVFSSISNNSIHEIHVRQLFGGAEMAGIKIHGAIDVQIMHNHIYRTCLGLWLDWMAQGARISGNLFENNRQDLFFEVDHGPILVDNNLFLSAHSMDSRSQGVALVHNLFGGTLRVNKFDDRQTPFLKPHSTELAGFHHNPRGDDRYYNNLFAGGDDLSQYDDADLPVKMNGNIFFPAAKPSPHETPQVAHSELPLAFHLVEESGSLYLEMKYDPAWAACRKRELVTTKLLGKAFIPNQAYEQPDGTRIRIDTDYFGKRRNRSNPAPGPFENPGESFLKLKVW